MPSSALERGPAQAIVLAAGRLDRQHPLTALTSRSEARGSTKTIRESRKLVPASGHHRERVQQALGGVGLPGRLGEVQPVDKGAGLGVEVDLGRPVDLLGPDFEHMCGARRPAKLIDERQPCLVIARSQRGNQLSRRERMRVNQYQEGSLGRTQDALPVIACQPEERPSPFAKPEVLRRVGDPLDRADG